MNKIEGVTITLLKKIPDERGSIMHMLRNDDPHFEKFGEIYFSTAYPGSIKGWHEHKEQVQNYAVVQGMIKLVMHDNRKESKTYKNLIEIFMGDLNYVLVRIPTGVINGYKAIGDKTAIVANCSTIPHSQGEMIRYDPINSFVNYNWDLVHK
ncbi:MAG: dTDP-4-dehydrorhamnose 3,5-epimerase family protein [SAR202 cluster bacterium]|nr:dTDP-4-dehydrorhamnose 3,5-epimerase family protein [SAR202 cluster bacterium]